MFRDQYRRSNERPTIAALEIDEERHLLMPALRSVIDPEQQRSSETRQHLSLAVTLARLPSKSKRFFQVEVISDVFPGAWRCGHTAVMARQVPP